MRISDWSSDVCSSDLGRVGDGARTPAQAGHDDCIIGRCRCLALVGGVSGRRLSLGGAILSRCGGILGEGGRRCHQRECGRRRNAREFCEIDHLFYPSRYVSTRSEERRVGKGCVSKCRYRLVRYHKKKKTKNK